MVNPKILTLPRCMRAGRSLQERMRLLSVLVVGGGPTGVEFCGELGDFIRSVRASCATGGLTRLSGGGWVAGRLAKSSAASRATSSAW